MVLRQLKMDDVDYMLEWLLDPNLNDYFKIDTANICNKSIRKFILSSITDVENLHLAIAADDDEYLGTISLKSINFEDSNAEYAISLREKAKGTKAAMFATDIILYIAFMKLKLNKVYFNVLSSNKRAINFYKKYGFKYEGELKKHIRVKSVFCDLELYGILSSDFDNLNKIVEIECMDQCSYEFLDKFDNTKERNEVGEEK